MSYKGLQDEQEMVSTGGGQVADAQKQYFDRGRMQGIFDEGHVEAAQAADPKEISGLKEASKSRKKAEQADIATEQSDRVGSIIAAEGEMTMEMNIRQDAHPLTQLQKLQTAYATNRPSRIYYKRHKEKLAHYIKPNQVDGDVVFYQNSAYILMHKYDESKGQGFLTIKQVALTELLDFVEEDRSTENLQSKQICKVKVFDFGPAAKDIQKMHDDSKQEIYLAFKQSKGSKLYSWLQNGKHLYIYSLVRKGGFGSGSTACSLLDIDLETGKESTVSGFDFEDQDSAKGMIVSVGFVKRETDGRYPARTGATPQSFVASLKNQLIFVSKNQLDNTGTYYERGGAQLSLRLLSMPKQDFTLINEAQICDKFQRVIGINNDDALYIEEQHLHVQMPPRYLDFSEGLIFIHQDVYGKLYYKVFRIARAESGTVTACTPDKSLNVNPEKIECLIDKADSSTYRYLYDQMALEFFFAKTTPVEKNALVIFDSIMKKVIQITQDEERLGLKLTKLTNHGISFQQISCKKLSELSTQYKSFRESHSTLSYALAYKFAELSLRKNQQIVISRQYSNMARCEDTIFYWHKGETHLCKAYDDPDLQVASLSLQYSDFFLNASIRQQTQSLRMEQHSYISQITRENWQTGNQRMEGSPAQDIRYTRLFSWDGQMLLARVKNVPGVRDTAPSVMGRLMAQNEAAHMEDFKQEDRVELFKFQLAGVPDQREEALIKYDQDWRLYYERIRFVDDDRWQRPLVFQQSIRDESNNITGQRFWFCIYDIKKEQIVRQISINLPELNVPYQIESVSVSACTEVKQDKSKSDRYNQKYIVAIPLKHQRRVKMIEYTVTWDYHIPSVPSVIIRPTGVKDFYKRLDHDQNSAVFALTDGLEEIQNGSISKFAKPTEELNIQVLPFMDSTNRICGTQIILGTGQNAQLYVIEKSEERASNKMCKIPLTKNQGYKLFKDESTFEYSAVLAYTHLTKAMQHDQSLNDQDRLEILEDSVKAVLNSVIFDPTVPAPTSTKDRNYNDRFLKFIDIGRGVEVFDWYSTVSIKATSDELYSLLESSRRTEDIYTERYSCNTLVSFMSLLERVLIYELAYQDASTSKVISEDQQTVDYDRLTTLRSNGTLLYGHEIVQRDIFFNHPLNYLFYLEEKEKTPKDKYLHNLLEFIFTPDNGGPAPVHYEAQKHLMGMIVDIVDRPDTQTSFFTNFIAQSGSDLNINMCRLVQYDTVPKSQDSELQGFQYLQPEYMLRKSAADVAKLTLSRNKRKDGHELPVDCLVFDMRQHNFEQKVKYIKKNVNQEGKLDYEVYDKKRPSFVWTAYDTCALMAGILEKTDGDIKTQRMVRLITDHQYSLKTKSNSLRMLMLYTFGFFVPFFVQLTWQEETPVITSNVLCLLTSLFLFRFEIEQMKIQGDAYFESFMNWVDIFGFLTFLTYFCLRMLDPTTQLPSFQQEPIDDLLTVMSFPIILYTAMKLLFYFQMFEGFGLFMHLVTETLKNMSIFMPFLFFWVFVFSCQLYSLGGSYPAGDYPELHTFLIILIATWRNSVGDIYVPEYPNWSANLQAEDKDVADEEAVGTTYTYTMISLVWLVWFLNLLFLFLILTNFLISIIGNSFGDNIDKNEEVGYANKIDLNVEAALYKRWWGSDKKFDTIVFLVAKEEDEVTTLDTDAILVKINSQMDEQSKNVSAAQGALAIKSK